MVKHLPYLTLINGKQFQTDFWQIQHCWYTEYSSNDNTKEIYTVPYVLDKYHFTAIRLKRYYKMIDNRHSFENITKLNVYPETLFNNEYQHYFPNVPSLIFNRFSGVIRRTFLLNEHLEILKTMIDLNKIKHLSIAITCLVQTPLTLFENKN